MPVPDVGSNKKAMAEGFVDSGGFLGSILAGLFLGLFFDWLLGTDPWLVVIGIVAGSITGFYRMMEMSRRAQEESARG